MSDVIHWSCTYCKHDATLRGFDFVLDDVDFLIQNPAEGHKSARLFYVVCPNPACRKYTLSVELFDCDKVKAVEHGGIYDRVANKKLIRVWNLVPPSKAKTYPDYIPKPIIDDYSEACLIVDLSPKASATLSRRCLQGIIRDFWQVNPGKLANEIDQIKDKTDAITWEAIDSVRKVGNIGAHMEKDIDLIVDIDPNEANLLVNLIEILLKDWYVDREEKRNRLAQIKSISNKKDALRKEEDISK